MSVYRDGVQMHQSNSSSLLPLSPPPALTSDSWAVSITAPQHVPVTCLRSVQMKERMKAEDSY